MPVEPTVLIAFILATLALVMSPGPDTMVVLRSALAAGVPAGIAAVLGVQAGLVVHTTAAALGVSLIIASSPLLFSALAIAGAGYLAWLGLQSLRGGGLLSVAALGRRTTVAQAFREAALCNLLNPKVIVLFLALLPNFVVPGRGAVTAHLVTLGVVLIAINTLWQLPLVWIAGAVRRWLNRPAIQRAIGRVSGAILLVFAAALLIQHFA